MPNLAFFLLVLVAIFLVFSVPVYALDVDALNGKDIPVNVKSLPALPQN
uniref:Uncharacterized protein n=1 Tax=Anopheles funestus TaxID=62324 RepID=A0A4Y0BG57_ANOFN